MIDRAAGDGDVSRTLGLLSRLGPREVNVDRRWSFPSVPASGRMWK
jgi:hypothetical protein